MQNVFSKYSIDSRGVKLQFELTFVYLTSGVQTRSSLVAVKLPFLDLKVRTGSFQTGMPPQLGEKMQNWNLRGNT